MAFSIQVINTRHNPQVEAYARDRLALVVGRYEHRLESVDVHVRDVNGKKGGKEKTCSIDANLAPRGRVHVTATEADVYSAVLKAIHRLETVVAKSIDRGNRGRNVRHQQGGLRNDTERQVDSVQALDMMEYELAVD